MKRHHLILVREIDSYSPIATGVDGDGTARPWDGSSALVPERRDRIHRVGAIYRAVRDALRDEVEVTVVDPRNLAGFLALVLRDSWRYAVPASTALRSMGANCSAAGILDGQILFEGTPPPPERVLELIRGRLVVHRA